MSTKTTSTGLFAAPWFKSSLILLVVCALVGFLVSLLPYNEVLNKNWVDVHIRDSGMTGMLVFLVIGATATALGAPRQMIAFLGGYAFGFALGCLLSTLATALSCFFSFYFSRLLAKRFIQKRFAHKIKRIDQFLHKDPLTKTIVIRLLPVGNNLVTNLIAGVTHVRASRFVFGSFIGYIPQMAIFALMGKGIVVLSAWKIALSVVLLIISGALSLRLYKQYKAARLLDDESADVIGNTPV
ncbi:MAG: VTT domain-containing protein [Paraglaciecola sp.]|uniref:TVP38/TMEM64 family protein n=1 Tax=Pseudomonadati TaxID=3379134 RepID=UPI00273DE2BE|nr:VTT domain-containing protein [Paraglaciecola sp.]MDP5031696.1 VTT domain-containing protein [Paraglaciecola sp.]MDP5133500.1 VTT domain-containing protein [Paraglaciecola sp.]